MTSARNTAVRLLLNQFRARGWSGDQEQCALTLVNALFKDKSLLERQQDLGRLVPSGFLLAHGITGGDVGSELRSLRDKLVALLDSDAAAALPPLLAIDRIDSFARVAEISAADVAALCPLDLLEDDVERIIAGIIGEPFRQKDWGGELDDLFTPSVQLEGRLARASFLLKGRGLGSVMKMKDLGSNGDQVMRMVKQPAELFVVQHVNRIDASVYSHLSDAIVARRAEGYPVVGSVWDGVMIARLGVAYGYLDPGTGALIPGALTPT